jgi:predicted O-methyltransferase YrrM
LLVVALPAAVVVAQRWRADALSTMPAPTSASPVEAKVLGVLDRMVKNRETYLSVDADNGRMLRLLAESIGARNCVEIGTSTGYSGLWTLLALRNTGGRLTTFELDPGRAAQARKHFEEAGVEGQVTIVLGDAHQNVKQVKGPIDLLFLDADKEGYASYLQALLPLVRPGGLIAADNIASAPDYVKAVTTDPRLDTVFFGRFAVTMKKRLAGNDPQGSER